MKLYLQEDLQEKREREKKQALEKYLDTLSKK